MLYSTFEIAVAIVVAILLVIIFMLHWLWGLIGAGLVIGAYLYVRKTVLKEYEQQAAEWNRMGKGLQQMSSFALQNLPIGMVIVDNHGKICWTNSVFRDWLPVGDSDKTTKLSGFIPAMRMDKVWGKSGFFQETIDSRHYRVVYKTLDTTELTGDVAQQEDVPSYMAFYFEDITDSEEARIKLMNQLPAFGFIVMDNIEDLSAGLSDVEYTNLWAEINRIIVAEIDHYGGFVRNTAEDTYAFAVGREAFMEMMAGKFSFIAKIHNLQTSKHIPPTISVGMALTTDRLKEQTEKARAALEIALGRGGDQACVNDNDEMKFFGGTTKGLEKNTRVRARVVSQALHEIMKDAENIIVMGHEREDYDSFGASIGVATMARALNKPVHIVISDNPVGIEKLVTAVKEDEELAQMIIDEEMAEEFVHENTVVIVTDVHRADMVAAPKVLEKSSRRVVIDHHRRGSDFIEKQLLTYLEPASSSTSELVTELIQYFNSHVALKKVEAGALYAGIVVDTKNFVVQTGARTFEAASFLRRSGADVTFVRHLFMKNFDAMQLRAIIMAGAEQVDHMAFAQAPDHVQNGSVVAAQAADSLISIEGIEASFVLYNLLDGGIGVSARSQGDMNVQLVMEALGGGGHRTVAGAQLSGVNMAEAKANVMEVARRAMAEMKAEQEKMEEIDG